MSYKTHDFSPDGYDEDSIVGTSEVFFDLLDYSRPRTEVFTVQERHLESEDNLYSLGFSSQESEYFYVSKQGDERPWFTTNLVKEFLFFMHPDVVHQQRVVFTFFDALGDIGGLRDVLVLVGQLLVTLYGLIFGSHLDMFLISNLFKFEREARESKKDDELSHITERKSATFKVCVWCLSSRRKKKRAQLLEKA